MTDQTQDTRVYEGLQPDAKEFIRDFKRAASQGLSTKDAIRAAYKGDEL